MDSSLLGNMDNIEVLLEKMYNDTYDDPLDGFFDKLYRGFRLKKDYEHYREKHDTHANIQRTDLDNLDCLIKSRLRKKEEELMECRLKNIKLMRDHAKLLGNPDCEQTPDSILDLSTQNSSRKGLSQYRLLQNDQTSQRNSLDVVEELRSTLTRDSHNFQELVARNKHLASNSEKYQTTIKNLRRRVINLQRKDTKYFRKPKRRSKISRRSIREELSDNAEPDDGVENLRLVNPNLRRTCPTIKRPRKAD